MVNYSKGKIYKVEGLVGDMCYIGSTTKEYLSQRMDQHRSAYRRWKATGERNYSVFDIFEAYGFEKCRIVLIELVPCESKDELLKRETHFIKTIECVNRCSSFQSKSELQDYTKQWYVDNKTKHNENSVIYYKAHAEHLKSYQKEYNNTHIKLKTTCECGSTYRKQDHKRHKETAKHINYIANQLTDV